MLNLTDFLQTVNRHETAAANPALDTVLASCAAAAVKIAAKVRLGALAGVLGAAVTDNVQGERQKKLDIIANQIMLATLAANAAVGGMASEEEEHFVSGTAGGRYLVLFDPLDGSSNVDINAPVGTIFSVLARPDAAAALSEKDFLQPGTAQLAAGYALFGPQTVLTLTAGSGVYMFTLDAAGDFILTRADCKIAAATGEFALNYANYRHWRPAARIYAEELLQGQSGPRRRDYNLRWSACLVADAHRLLMRGGVFLYPEDNRVGMERGKLRLLYEANPIGLLMTAAGGLAAAGKNDILQIMPQGLHQRTPLILGAAAEVEHYRRCCTEHSYS